MIEESIPSVVRPHFMVRHYLKDFLLCLIEAYHSKVSNIEPVLLNTFTHGMARFFLSGLARKHVRDSVGTQTLIGSFLPWHPGLREGTSSLSKAVRRRACALFTAWSAPGTFLTPDADDWAADF